MANIICDNNRLPEYNLKIVLKGTILFKILKMHEGSVGYSFFDYDAILLIILSIGGSFSEVDFGVSLLCYIRHKQTAESTLFILFFCYFLSHPVFAQL
jgi:hypothetical protein